MLVTSFPSELLQYGLQLITAFGPRSQATIIKAATDSLMTYYQLSPLPSGRGLLARQSDAVLKNWDLYIIQQLVTTLEGGKDLLDADSVQFFFGTFEDFHFFLTKKDAVKLDADVAQRLFRLLQGYDKREVSINPAFPYQVLTDGGYQLPPPNLKPLKVAVLGDVDRLRTQQLTAAGHLVVDTPADLVEAYNFIGSLDLDHEGLGQGLSRFVADALLARLGPTGRGILVVNKDASMIAALDDVIRANVELLSLEVVYNEPAPLPGGLAGLGSSKSSWLVFRRATTHWEWPHKKARSAPRGRSPSQD